MIMGVNIFLQKVVTRHTSLQNRQRSQDLRPILSEIMGYNKTNVELYNFKYGHKMEIKGWEMYCKRMIESGHVNMEVALCGLYIDKSEVYLGASPDLLASCDCHGQGLVEFKSPVVKDTIIDDTFCHNLPYLDDQLKLKQTHDYYYQCQGQMALTGRKWCDFVIVLPTNIYVEQITFDEIFWLETKPKLSAFLKKMSFMK